MTQSKDTFDPVAFLYSVASNPELDDQDGMSIEDCAQEILQLREALKERDFLQADIRRFYEAYFLQNQPSDAPFPPYEEFVKSLAYRKFEVTR